MIERLLPRVGAGGQWHRHASTAFLALGGGIFLGAFGAEIFLTLR